MFFRLMAQCLNMRDFAYGDFAGMYRHAAVSLFNEFTALISCFGQLC